MQTDLGISTTPEGRIRSMPRDFNLRMAEVSDVSGILKHGKEFFDLSLFKRFGAEYSESNLESYLRILLDNMYCPVIVALVKDEVVGWCQFQYDISAFKKPVAVLNTLFVTKKHRRSVVGRMLLATAMEIAKEEQACTFVVPVNSGSDYINSLGNMLSKGGFTSTGYIMTRGL